jgi:hypothetical protein
MMHRWKLLAVLAWQTASIAQADTFVVPVDESAPTPKNALSTLQRHIEHVMNADGHRVMSGRAAANAIGKGLREAAPEPPPALHESFTTAAMAAHEGLADGSDARDVLSRFTDVREALIAAPEIWNTPSRQREVHGACLGAVSVVTRQTGMRDAAVRLASWCMATLDQRLTEHLAPPNLMPIYRAASAALDHQVAGPVSFKAPEGCRMFTDGRLHAAHGPLYQRPYSVFARCADGDSRVQVIQPNADPTVVEIDPSFDRALLITSDGVRLRRSEAAKAVNDAARLRWLASASGVLLISRREHGFTLQQVPGNRALLPTRYSEAELRSALKKTMVASANHTKKGK